MQAIYNEGEQLAYLLSGHVVEPGEDGVHDVGLVVLQALFQSEQQQHEDDGDDEGDGLGPLEHDLGGRHGQVAHVGRLGDVDPRRPVLLLDQLLQVGDAVGDHVVEHDVVERGDAVVQHQHLVAQSEEEDLQSKFANYGLG
jgi:hypothetical protein